ncbi:MAG: phosphatidylglycerol lysyltransferase domain-containing protein [Oscillospiraceae bacterium]
MTEFRQVTISDKEWADGFLLAENSRSADYNFGNIYMWDHTFRQHLAAVDGRLVTKLKYEELPFFAFPVGSGDPRPALDTMAEVAAQRGFPLRIRGITEEQRGLLESVCPDRFDFIEDRDCFDYIYSAEKLATMGGKKLHGKRNHCNRFEQEQSWDFVPLTRDLVPVCMEMLGEWQGEFEMPPDGLEDEHAAIMRCFMRYRPLGLEGGVLRIEGRVVGFTIGERTSDDTYDIHFEKAFASVNGAYPMVCREFARQLLSAHPEIVYLNREDDMGKENLRKAKLDFYPEYLLKKYSARER